MRACRGRDIPVRTLPGVFELISGSVNLMRQVREVQVEDVLGREPVTVEVEQAGSYLTDRTVLVTGAGGSIGSELCRQISRVKPRLLVMLDHAEGNLFEIERELISDRHFTGCESILADCRDDERMSEVMRRFSPNVIFHAAAYKHVALTEDNPLEAVRNNAIGTKVVATAAAEAGADRFVLVSTDKAVKPATALGASKAMAEWIVEAFDHRYPGTAFCSVRFGNVLASSGSVVPLFRKQIEKGGPVTVTHPDMARYFMTIPEAVQLIIRSGKLANGGEVFVLEMGEQVKIIDLARNMIRLSGQEVDRDIRIEITGPRPGEKLREELFNDGEQPVATEAERIVKVEREPFDTEWIDVVIDAGRAADRARRRGVPRPARRRAGDPAASADDRGPRRDAETMIATLATIALPAASIIERIGAYVGFFAFLGLAILALLYFSQARDVRRLREWAGRAPERAAELESRARRPGADTDGRAQGRHAARDDSHSGDRDPGDRDPGGRRRPGTGRPDRRRQGRHRAAADRADRGRRRLRDGGARDRDRRARRGRRDAASNGDGGDTGEHDEVAADTGIAAIADQPTVAHPTVPGGVRAGRSALRGARAARAAAARALPARRQLRLDAAAARSRSTSAHATFTSRRRAT